MEEEKRNLERGAKGISSRLLQIEDGKAIQLVEISSDGANFSLN
jgi:hypothetical protein